MKCLRIYATPDGESHFGEVDIAMTMKPAFPNEAPFELSAYYPASRIRFSHIPAGVARESGLSQTPPDRLLAIWLGVATWNLKLSDGEVRRLPAGKSCSRRGYARERTHLAPPRRGCRKNGCVTLGSKPKVQTALRWETPASIVIAISTSPKWDSPSGVERGF